MTSTDPITLTLFAIGRFSHISVPDGPVAILAGSPEAIRALGAHLLLEVEVRPARKTLADVRRGLNEALCGDLPADPTHITRAFDQAVDETNRYLNGPCMACGKSCNEVEAMQMGGKVRLCSECIDSWAAGLSVWRTSRLDRYGSHPEGKGNVGTHPETNHESSPLHEEHGTLDDAPAGRLKGEDARFGAEGLQHPEVVAGGRDERGTQVP